MARRRKSARKSARRSSRRNPGDVRKLMKEYDRALDKWYDMKLSTGKMTAIAKRCIAAGCPKHRLDDLGSFVKGAWGSRY